MLRSSFHARVVRPSSLGPLSASRYLTTATSESSTSSPVEPSITPTTPSASPSSDLPSSASEPAQSHAQSPLATKLSPSAPQTPQNHLPYLVARTPSLALPVYQRNKRGGNLKETVVKRVDGDKAALRDSLAKALGLEKGMAKWNPRTGHIEVKGHVRNKIIQLLEEQGF